MNKPATVVALSLLLAGCGAERVSCGDAAGVDVVKGLIMSAAQEHAMAQAEGKASSIRASQSNFQTDLSAFRTDKKDPDSKRVFCAAQLSYRLEPTQVVALEASAKSIQSVGSLDNVATPHGFERNANVFVKTEFKYSLQPTDDGTMIFAEILDVPAVSMLSELILLDVIREASTSSTRINVQSELERLKAEEAAVQSAAQRVASERQSLAQQQQQLAQDQRASHTTAQSSATPPGFDCRKATSEVEQLICSDAQLAAMDARLNVLYSATLNSSSDPGQLRRVQISWVEYERNTCADIPCLKEAYSSRIRELSTPPQATAPKLAVHPILAAIPTDIPDNADFGYAYANTPEDGFLSLRSHPSTSQGQRLIKIPHGEGVTIFECPATPREVVGGVAGSWCTAEYEGIRGFVFDAYLTD